MLHLQDEVVTSTYSTRTRSTRQKLPTQEEEILSDSHITGKLKFLRATIR